MNEKAPAHHVVLYGCIRRIEADGLSIFADGKGTPDNAGVQISLRSAIRFLDRLIAAEWESVRRSRGCSGFVCLYGYNGISGLVFLAAHDNNALAAVVNCEGSPLQGGVALGLRPVELGVPFLDQDSALDHIVLDGRVGGIERNHGAVLRDLEGTAGGSGVQIPRGAGLFRKFPISVREEIIDCGGRAGCIRGQREYHRVGGVGLAVHHHAVVVLVYDLEHGALQARISLGFFPVERSVPFFHADAAPDDGLLYDRLVVGLHRLHIACGRDLADEYLVIQQVS